MKTISVSDVRHRIRLLTDVKEPSAITNHGRIVAILVPVAVRPANEVSEAIAEAQGLLGKVAV